MKDFTDVSDVEALMMFGAVIGLVALALIVSDWFTRRRWRRSEAAFHAENRDVKKGS